VPVGGSAVGQSRQQLDPGPGVRARQQIERRDARGLGAGTVDGRRDV